MQPVSIAHSPPFIKYFFKSTYAFRKNIIIFNHNPTYNIINVDLLNLFKTIRKLQHFKIMNKPNLQNISQPLQNSQSNQQSFSQSNLFKEEIFQIEHKRCRICLEETNDKKLALHNKQEKQIENHLRELPCECRDDHSLAHNKCIKYWIKIWLQKYQQRSINNQQRRYRNIRNRTNEENIEHVGENVQSNSHNPDFLSNLEESQTENKKSINYSNLKQKTIYPFYCEICHSPMYFDLLFHFRLKNFNQITRKSSIIFLVLLCLSVAFLGVSINWLRKEGPTVQSILFNVLFCVPLLCFTFILGMWAFTKKEFWVKNIYSKSQRSKIESMKRKSKEKIQQSNNQNKQQKRIQKQSNKNNLQPQQSANQMIYQQLSNPEQLVNSSKNLRQQPKQNLQHLGNFPIHNMSSLK